MNIFKNAMEWPSRLKEIPLMSKTNKRTWWIVVVATLLLISAGGYAYYTMVYAPSKTTTTALATMQTAPVRQGQADR
jgi:hypothetical protein